MTGCSSRHAITADDVQSQLTLAISTASESELFIDRLREHRATSRFAHAHALYLANALKQSLEDLSRPTLDQRTQSLAEQCRAQLLQLDRELSLISSSANDAAALAAAKARIAKIHADLQRLEFSP